MGERKMSLQNKWRRRNTYLWRLKGSYIFVSDNMQSNFYKLNKHE